MGGRLRESRAFFSALLISKDDWSNSIDSYITYKFIYFSVLKSPDGINVRAQGVYYLGSTYVWREMKISSQTVSNPSDVYNNEPEPRCVYGLNDVFFATACTAPPTSIKESLWRRFQVSDWQGLLQQVGLATAELPLHLRLHQLRRRPLRLRLLQFEVCECSMFR